MSFLIVEKFYFFVNEIFCVVFVSNSFDQPSQICANTRSILFEQTIDRRDDNFDRIVTGNSIKLVQLVR